MAGTLYIVATPIGNLEDMTLRALRVLREADVVLCEDTRQTRKLLDHFTISKPTLSYHDHNERDRAPELVERLKQGETLALVSDAGTPLISDPGYRVVRAALDAGISVVPIPGASAALVALSASGLATDAFRFCGFFPQKQGQRVKVLKELAREEATLVFYEAPHRIIEALEDIAANYGDRPVVVARELTKLHEEFLRGSAEEIRVILGARPSVKGEITVLIGKGEPVADEVPLEVAVERLVAAGIPRMDAIKEVAQARGLSKREVYRLLLQ